VRGLKPPGYQAPFSCGSGGVNVHRPPPRATLSRRSSLPWPWCPCQCSRNACGVWHKRWMRIRRKQKTKGRVSASAGAHSFLPKVSCQVCVVVCVCVCVRFRIHAAVAMVDARCRWRAPLRTTHMTSGTQTTHTVARKRGRYLLPKSVDYILGYALGKAHAAHLEPLGLILPPVEGGHRRPHGERPRVWIGFVPPQTLLLAFWGAPASEKWH
jgi:hypothetical protein